MLIFSKLGETNYDHVHGRDLEDDDVDIDENENTRYEDGHA